MINSSHSSALIPKWTGYLEGVRGLAPGTVKRYRRAVETAIGHLEKDPREVCFDDLERHLKRLWSSGQSASTIAGAVAALRSFYEYLSITAAVKESPARHLRGPRVYVREAPTLTLGEIDKLIFNGRKGRLPSDPYAARNRVMLAVSYVCGLRVSEPGRLRLRHVEYDCKFYSILLERAKHAAADRRISVADPTVSRMLGAYLQLRSQISSPWLFPSRSSRNLTQLHSRTVGESFKAGIGRCGIRKKGRQLTFQILRHSLATHLHARGWPPKAIRDWMRHKSLATTQRYIHVGEEQMRCLWARKNPLTARRAAVPDVHAVGRALVSDLSGLA